MKIRTKAALSVFMVLLVSCTGATSQKKSEAIPVKTMEVNLGDTDQTKSYVGTAREIKSARVGCRHTGELVSILVRKGDHVQKGSTLAVISSQSVLTAKEIADATLKQALDGYDRIKKMHESNSIPEVKMVEIETQLAKAQAAADAANKAVEECSVTAPFSGVVEEIYVEEGTHLDLLQDIVKLVDISSMEIHFSVPENEWGKIHEGDLVSCHIPALNIENATAIITHKGVCASPLSHTYDCVLRPQQPIQGLMPGMVCKVYLDCNQGWGAVVPASLIRTDETGRYVWVVRDQIVSKRYIQTDGYSGNGVIVREGLEEGDQIITEGVQKVCSGMKVSIVK